MILYLGTAFEHSTTAHRANALRRLGHDVVHIDPLCALPRGRIIGGLSTRVGLGLFSPLTLHYLKSKVDRSAFDVVWIDGGPELGPAAYRWLKQAGMKIINYNVDDPFGTRDGRKWSLYKAAVHWHDLTAVVRAENIAEARFCGAKNVVRVFRSYDPVAHASFEPSDDERRRFAAQVSFIGAWMPERGPLLSHLLDLGVPLSIWGNRWEKAMEWPRLRSAWRGPALYGREFVAATLCSKVALGLLSKGNRDLHTQRSAEVPYMGGAAFCAERTTEHSAMFNDDKEAVFWSNAEECASQCAGLLADETRRIEIVRAAQSKVQALALSNDAVMAFLLNKITNSSCDSSASVPFGVQITLGKPG